MWERRGVRWLEEEDVPWWELFVYAQTPLPLGGATLDSRVIEQWCARSGADFWDTLTLLRRMLAAAHTEEN